MSEVVSSSVLLQSIEQEISVRKSRHGTQSYDCPLARIERCGRMTFGDDHIQCQLCGTARSFIECYPFSFDCILEEKNNEYRNEVLEEINLCFDAKFVEKLIYNFLMGVVNDLLLNKNKNNQLSFSFLTDDDLNRMYVLVDMAEDIRAGRDPYAAVLEDVEEMIENRLLGKESKDQSSQEQKEPEKPQEQYYPSQAAS